MRVTRSLVPRIGNVARLLVGVFAVVLAAGERVSAARDPVARCAAGKITATAKNTAGELNCHAKALGKGHPVNGECLAKVEATFAREFAKADEKGGCATVNDVGARQGDVDTFVAAVLAALPRGSTADGRKCAAAKIKATGKETAGKLKCHATAMAKGLAPDPDCLRKLGVKLVSAFTRAENKGGCPTVGDTETIEHAVDSFVDALVASFSGATTTTVPTSTTLSGPPTLPTPTTITIATTTTTTAPTVSFATQVQPIFNARCALSGCHSGASPTGGLDLSAGVARGNLVNQPSSECPSFKRVAPGAPGSSYIIFKLQGFGPCFAGAQMPFGRPPLSAANIDTIRTWIRQGAANN